MCGIAGIVRIEPSGVALEPLVRAMADTLRHRGPDDAGVWQSDDGHVALSHRRLSIIDLSPLGHNPMSWDDGRLWITFNGEIYNFLELRQELEVGWMPIPIAHRYRGDPRGVRPVGHRLRSAARRDVRLRHLGLAADGDSGSRAIDSARSRCTTRRQPARCDSPPS